MYVFISVLGAFVIPDKYLKWGLLIVPLTILDWNDFDGQCFLTRIESQLRGTWNPKEATEEGGPEFFRPIIQSIFGTEISRVSASRLNYVMFIVGWLALYYRFIQKKYRSC